MDNIELLDRLKRAYTMEEQMTGLLIDLCQPEVLPDSLSAEIRQRITNILHSIKIDTLRHEKDILEMQNKIK